MATYLTDSQKALIETALYLRGDALRRRMTQLETLTSDVDPTLAAGERLELVQIEDALCRVPEANFGCCADCADPIPFDRLRSRPHGLYCAACESARAQKARRRLTAGHS